MAETRERVAIVVGRQDYGEADRILRLLSPEEGRISAMLRGARRRRGDVDLGCRVRLSLRHGRGELDNVAAVDVEDPRASLREGLGRLAAAAYACELCAAFAHAGQPEPRLYGLLETTLLLLDAASADPGPALLPVLEAKLLSFAGLTPVLDRCVACREPLAEPLFYAATGVAHGHCGAGAPVTLAFVRALEAARRAPLAQVLDGELPEDPGNVPWLSVVEALGRELPSRAVAVAMRG